MPLSSELSNGSAGSDNVQPQPKETVVQGDGLPKKDEDGGLNTGPDANENSSALNTQGNSESSRQASNNSISPRARKGLDESPALKDLDNSPVPNDNVSKSPRLGSSHATSSQRDHREADQSQNLTNDVKNPSRPNSSLSRSPRPNSIRSRSPRPNSSRSKSPRPNSRESKSPRPNGIQSKSPRPNSSQAKSPRPNSSQAKSPRPNSRESKSPRPNGIQSKSPRPNSSQSKSPRPNGSQAKSPRPNSSESKSARPNISQDKSPQPNSTTSITASPKQHPDEQVGKLDSNKESNVSSTAISSNRHQVSNKAAPIDQNLLLSHQQKPVQLDILAADAAPSHKISEAKPPKSKRPVQPKRLRISTATPTAESSYVETKNLKPISQDQLKGSLQEVIGTIGLENKEQDWKQTVNSLETLRRLAVHHPGLLLDIHERQGVFPTICKALEKHVRNLRSVVAKNAILATQDFCSSMKVKVGPGIDLLSNALLQRSIDTNTFIRDSAVQALATLTAKCACSTLVGSLVQVYNGKAAAFRKQVSFFLLRTLENMSRSRLEHVKKLNDLVVLCTGMLDDPAGVIRQVGKSIISLLAQSGVIYPKNMRTLLSGPPLYRLLREIEQVQVTTNAGNTKVTASTPKHHSKESIRKLATPKKRYTNSSDTALEEINTIAKKATKQERQKQLSSITRLATVSPSKQLTRPEKVKYCPPKPNRTPTRPFRNQVPSRSSRKPAQSTGSYSQPVHRPHRSSPTNTRRPSARRTIAKRDTPVRERDPKRQLGEASNIPSRMKEPNQRIRQSNRSRAAEELHLSRKHEAAQRAERERREADMRALPPVQRERPRYQVKKPEVKNVRSNRTGYELRAKLGNKSWNEFQEARREEEEYTKLSPLAHELDDTSLGYLNCDVDIGVSAIEAAEMLDSTQLTEALEQQWIVALNERDTHEVEEPQKESDPFDCYPEVLRTALAEKLSINQDEFIDGSTSLDIVELGEYKYGEHGMLIPVRKRNAVQNVSEARATALHKVNELPQLNNTKVAAQDLQKPRVLSNTRKLTEGHIGLGKKVPNKHCRVNAKTMEPPLLGLRSRVQDPSSSTEELEKQLLKELNDIDRLIRQRRKHYGTVNRARTQHSVPRLPQLQHSHATHLSPHYEALISS